MYQLPNLFIGIFCHTSKMLFNFVVDLYAVQSVFNSVLFRRIITISFSYFIYVANINCFAC